MSRKAVVRLSVLALDEAQAATKATVITEATVIWIFIRGRNRTPQPPRIWPRRRPPPTAHWSGQLSNQECEMRKHTESQPVFVTSVVKRAPIIVGQITVSRAK